MRAQRHADYSYRLAVDPPAAKEVRLFGLADWVIDRFTAPAPAPLRPAVRGDPAARAVGRRRAWRSCSPPTSSCSGRSAGRAADGDLDLAAAIVALQAAIGVSAIAFGGLNWALDGAAAPVAAVGTLEARDGAGRRPADATARRRRAGRARPGDPLPRRRRSATPAGRSCSTGFDLTIPAGSSLAIVGQNGAGKTTLAKLLCRLYDPVAGAVEADGIDLRALDLDDWRRHVTAVFQDFVRFELPLRDNVAPGRRLPTPTSLAALERRRRRRRRRPRHRRSPRATPAAPTCPGGQWQRVALARALRAVRAGAGVVLLDEPTAQLDVRGEAEIFERILAATRGRTTILVSHRFSTVRQADRICVLEHGAVVELGTHDELMALGGRYRTMFDLQASRFVEVDEHGEEVVHDRLD